MDHLVLKPIKTVDGEIVLPGSKSLSNRVLLLSALAEGKTKITNLLDSDDIRRMLESLRLLGIHFELSDDRTQCLVTGNGKPFSASEPLELYLGNAGTAIRPLCAALGLGHGTFTLTGDARMEERPIRDLVDALRLAGGQSSYLKAAGYPPIRIEAQGIRGGEFSVRGDISSQYLSSLLMAAPLFLEETVISLDGELVSKPYIDLTLEVISKFGSGMENDNYLRFACKGRQVYRSPGEFKIEGDASSASYFFAAAAIKGGIVRVRGLGLDSRQGDLRFLDVLETMGARVSRQQDSIEVGPARPLHGVEVDAGPFPDAAMTLAVVALFAQGRTVVKNVANWRVKETDRLSAMATELRKVGATVVEGSDFLEITPPPNIRRAAIDTYEDHRMAMCFSLVALSEAGVTINNPRCVSKTFPDYFGKFSSISHAT